MEQPDVAKSSEDSPQGITPEAVQAGQAVYTPGMLRMYDWWVLGISNRLIWRCPSPKLVAWYNQHVKAKHLDIGVGTGYFLDRCKFPVEQPEIALLDLNPNSLATTAQRISRYSPASFRQSVFEPLQLEGQTFESVGMNYLLHCLPGDMTAKQTVLQNAYAVLQPGGVLFGSTLLSSRVRRGFIAKRLMSLYNDKGFFCNAADSLESFQQALDGTFSRVDIQTVGCAALFAAWKE